MNILKSFAGVGGRKSFAIFPSDNTLGCFFFCLHSRAAVELVCGGVGCHESGFQRNVENIHKEMEKEC